MDCLLVSPKGTNVNRLLVSPKGTNVNRRRCNLRMGAGDKIPQPRRGCTTCIALRGPAALTEGKVNRE